MMSLNQKIVALLVIAVLDVFVLLFGSSFGVLGLIFAGLFLFTSTGVAFRIFHM